MSATENKWTYKFENPRDLYVITNGTERIYCNNLISTKCICDTLNRYESEAATLREEVKSEKEDKEYVMRMLDHKNKVNELMQNDFINLQSQLATLKAGLSVSELLPLIRWREENVGLTVMKSGEEIIKLFRNRNVEEQG